MRNALTGVGQLYRRLTNTPLVPFLLAVYGYVVYSGWVRWTFIGLIAFVQTIIIGRNRNTGPLKALADRFDQIIAQVVNAMHMFRKNRFPAWHDKRIQRTYENQQKELDKAGATWSYVDYHDAIIVSAAPVDDNWIQLDYLAARVGITNVDDNGNVIQTWSSEGHGDKRIGTIRCPRGTAADVTMLVTNLIDENAPVQIRTGTPRSEDVHGYHLLIEAPEGQRIQLKAGNPPDILKSMSH